MFFLYTSIDMVIVVNIFFIFFIPVLILSIESYNFRLFRQRLGSLIVTDHQQICKHEYGVIWH